MLTQFLTLSLDLTPASQLQDSILSELRRHGEPLRWAIVAIDAEGKVRVEAVMTT